jgi:hypothetical protein
MINTSKEKAITFKEKMKITAAVVVIISSISALSVWDPFSIKLRKETKQEESQTQRILRTSIIFDMDVLKRQGYKQVENSDSIEQTKPQFCAPALDPETKVIIKMCGDAPPVVDEKSTVK